MSVRQLLRDSRIFVELPPQSNGSVCFQVVEKRARLYGASIYVARDDSELHIRAAALDNGRFPNNRRLYDFVLEHAQGTIRGAGNPSYAYRLASGHASEIIDIIGIGSHR